MSQCENLDGKCGASWCNCDEVRKRAGSFAAPTGSDAAPKMLHCFKLDMTKKQAKQLREIWREHGGMNGMIIMQPVLDWGPCLITNTFAQCAVLNKECATMINDAIEKTKQPNTVYTPSDLYNEKPPREKH